MKIVWLARWDPRNPTDGQLLYSRGLIDGMRAAGAEVCVIANQRAGADTSMPEQIVAVPGNSGHRALSLLTGLQSDAFKHRSRAMAAAIATAIQPDTAAIVFDYFATGWALPLVKARCRALGISPRIVYVSHNHERTLRARVAREYRGNALMRAVLRLDAQKAARMERTLLDGAHVITSITEQDAAAFIGEAPHARHVTLLPAFDGPIQDDRRITPATPRRVLMMGSLEWIAKQENLLRFAASAHARFAASGIELVVLGKAPADFAERLREVSPHTNVVGFVDDPEPWLATSRIGLMPDTVGGGFKLRYLHYIFNGLPVATIRSQAVGLPFDIDAGMIVAGTPDQLVDAIVRVIDDVSRLESMRAVALAACRDRFSWKERGAALMAAISEE